jgi:hypothetical protein
LRAYTPRDQKAVQAAAETFRPNPALDTAQVITELGVGEALISFLDEKGRPNIVERAFVLPPASQIGPLTDEERAALSKQSVVAGIYEKSVDRESAYEKLKGRVAEKMPDDAEASARKGSNNDGLGNSDSNASQSGGGFGDMLGSVLGGGSRSGSRGRRSDSVVESMMKSAARTIGSTVGREIIRGVLGSILKRR